VEQDYVLDMNKEREQKKVKERIGMNKFNEKKQNKELKEKRV